MKAITHVTDRYRWISFFLLVSMCSFAHKECIAQSHDVAPTLKVRSIDAMKGQGVDVHIDANGFTSFDINAFELVLRYDSKMVNVKGVTMADTGREAGAASQTVLHNESVPGILRIAAAVSRPIVGGEKLLTIHFQILDREGTSTIEFEDVHLSGVTDPVQTIPGQIRIQPELVQNFPNPFSTSTTIRYALKSPSQVTLKIYNTMGQLVRTLVDEYQLAGPKSVEVLAKGFASGAYTYHLKTDYFEDSRQMVIVR